MSVERERSKASSSEAPLGEIETSPLALPRKLSTQEVIFEERKERDTAKRQMALEKDIGSLEGRLYGGATEEESATDVFHEFYEQKDGDEEAVKTYLQ